MPYVLATFQRSTRASLLRRLHALGSSDIGNVGFLAPTFHAAVEELLRRLDAAGQTKGAEYLNSSGSPCALININGLLTARWQRIFIHVTPCFSTFLSNTVESSWRVSQQTSDDALYLGKLRQLMGDYAIVGKSSRWPIARFAPR